MLRRLFQIAIATIAIAAPAQATSLVTFVSGQGTDTGSCATPSSACRGLAYAIDMTTPFGEVKVLDSAQYGSVTITKSINISGVEGASVHRAAGNAITINAGPNDIINISHLIFSGLNTADNGLVFNSGRSLNISHCVFRNFHLDGILIQPTTGTSYFQISDVIASDNGQNGIDVYPKVTATVNGVVDHALLHHNGAAGLQTYRNTNDTTANVTVSESISAGNGIYGFLGASQGILRLRHTTATDNTYGTFNNAGINSAGDNFITGNSNTDVAGPLPVVTQK